MLVFPADSNSRLVVCGDQSAGKSSVLEALTEVPFPRNENLCTRFSTELILRHANKDVILVRIIPDNRRPEAEKEAIRGFTAHVTDFSEFPSLIEKAKATMGIGDNDSGPAFSRDVLSIAIEGPFRPHLALVDLPGLIQTNTKGVLESDVKLVAKLTETYINQPRTICLASK
jgi:GTPase SAR1 family protein